MDRKRSTSSKKSGPGVEATAHRIEASRVVLSCLERTKTEEDIAFLKPLSENAIAVLDVIRAIDDGEVDDGFASLALDSCGLAFIAINECDKVLNDGLPIPDRLGWGADEIAEYLKDDIRGFMQKKISRGFLKKHLRHGADDEKVLKHRDKLRKWMGKLGVETDSSIHDYVEMIISEKVLKHDQEVQAARKSKDTTRLLQLQQQTQNIVPGSETDFPILTSSPSNSTAGRQQKPLPQITLSGFTDDLTGNGQTGSAIQSEVENNRSKERLLTAQEEETRKKKLEDERLARKAERERWRRSEHEFKKLPHVLTPLSSPSISRETQGLSPSATVETVPSVSRPREDDPVRPPLHDETKDRELAAQLQDQLAREIAEEDDRKALEVAASLQRQWEAEDEKGPPLAQHHPPASPRRHTSSNSGAGGNLNQNSMNTLSRMQADRRAPSSYTSTSPYSSRSASPSSVQVPPVGNTSTTSNSGNVSNLNVLNSFNSRPVTYHVRRQTSGTN